MGRKMLLENEAAEREANEVAYRFMNSEDVLADMRRAYPGRLDGVHVHDDAAADARVSAAGRDGIASGGDIYLKQGLLSSREPEDRGLIAHEMTHVMQQSGDGAGAGLQESVSYGEEQGGLRDWFRGKFGKKKEDLEKINISQPTLQKAVKSRVGVQGSGETLVPDFTADLSGVSPGSMEEELKYQEFVAADQFHVNRDLAHDPKIQDRAVRDFIAGGQKTMKNVGTERGALEAMRDNPTGIRGMANLLTGMLPEHFNDAMYQWGKMSMQGLDLDSLSSIREDRAHGAEREQEALLSDEVTDVHKINNARGVGLSMVQSVVDNDETGIGDILARAQGVFDGTAVQDQDQQSAYLMNFLLNRVITPHIKDTAQGKSPEGAKDAAETKQMMEYNAWLMQGGKFAFGKSLDGNKHQRFLSAMKKRFRK